MEEMNDFVLENLYSGINRIIGSYSFSALQNRFFQFDEKYLMKIFCKDDVDNEMKKLFEEIEIQEHLKRIYNPSYVLDEVNSYVNKGFDGSDVGDESSLVSSQPQTQSSVRRADFLIPKRTRRESEKSGVSGISK